MPFRPRLMLKDTATVATELGCARAPQRVSGSISKAKRTHRGIRCRRHCDPRGGPPQSLPTQHRPEHRPSVRAATPAERMGGHGMYALRGSCGFGLVESTRLLACYAGGCFSL